MTALRVYNKLKKSNITKEQLGAYYTPKVLSEWVADLACSFGQSSNILDPASGDGALLVPISRKCNAKLFAVDINSSELIKVRRRISTSSNVTLIEKDTLFPSKSVKSLDYWKNFFYKNDIGVVVSNPPWGAKIWESPSSLSQNGFTLGKGQYDSYELFVELMIGAANPGTFFIFIVPDSIFYSEHKNLRELVLRETKIHLLARLGEGFFRKVYRGTALLVLEKGQSPTNHRVECMRLNPQWRNDILLNRRSMQDALSKLSHQVEQERFFKNKDFVFDIDILSSNKAIDKIESFHKLKLSDYFETGRGVEISKKGIVLLCDKCNKAYPKPRKIRSIECTCGNTFMPKPQYYHEVITKKKSLRSVKLIVGEDVGRYECKPSRYIKKGIKGIDYKKSEIFSHKKLLIRKTGIGIKAAIDNSGSHTNQVVFHYIIRDSSKFPQFIMEYVLGVLSSRVMSAYYLQKYGDNEWRSHPYITQKVISMLPIPQLVEGEESYHTGRKIAHLVEEMNHCNQEQKRRIDLDIEREVIKLFSLTMEDVLWVKETLEKSRNMEPIRNIIIDNIQELLEET